jgi:hypothetical protein
MNVLAIHSPSANLHYRKKHISKTLQLYPFKICGLSFIDDTSCKLKHEALNAGLIVNNNKIKYLYCTRKTIQPTYIKTGEEESEQVSSFKYFGTIVNTDDCIEEKIKERIAAGNAAFRVHKK